MKKQIQIILYCLALILWFGGCAAGAYYDQSNYTNLGLFAFFAAMVLN